MMGNMGGMMWGMGLFWLIAIIVLVLAAAALVKYLFFRDRALWSRSHGRAVSCAGIPASPAAPAARPASACPAASASNHPDWRTDPGPATSHAAAPSPPPNSP